MSEEKGTLAVNHPCVLIAGLLFVMTAVACQAPVAADGHVTSVQQTRTAVQSTSRKVAHRTVNIDGLDIFYREAGPEDAPTVLLLHGFPTSSQMFRNLIPALADRYHVVAPDYPGFGHSSMPPRDQFAYTFDNLAAVMKKFTEKLGLRSYVLYLQDYGAPIGYRLAVMHPERVTAMVVQNGNAYVEGLENDFWKPVKEYWAAPDDKLKRDALRGILTYDATQWQYTHGVKSPELISPDGPAHDQFLLDAGHFALESDGDTIAALMRDFLGRHVAGN